MPGAAPAAILGAPSGDARHAARFRGHRSGGRDRPCRDAADPGALLAAAQRAHRRGDLGQAREPHPDRRVQAPRRAGLYGPAAPREPGGAGGDRGDKGQFRPERRGRGAPGRAAPGGRGAARQQPREERGHEGAGRRAGRPWRRFPGIARTCRGAGRCARPPHGPLLRLAAGAGDGDLCAGAVPQRPRPRRGLCADRARLGHLRGHRGARRARARDRDRRRLRRARGGLRAFVRGGTAGLDRFGRHHGRRHGLPGAGARGGRHRQPRRGAGRRGERGRDRGGDARLLHRHPQHRRGRRRRPARRADAGAPGDAGPQGGAHPVGRQYRPRGLFAGCWAGGRRAGAPLRAG